jgi:uncharacterized protein (DUF433 family)
VRGEEEKGAEGFSGHSGVIIFDFNASQALPPGKTACPGRARGPEQYLDAWLAPWRSSFFRIPIAVAYTEKIMDRQRETLAGVVTVDKQVLHGTPCFANTRVPVQTLIDFLETGESIDDFLSVYPSIPRQQVFSFLELSCDIAIDQLLCAS